MGVIWALSSMELADLPVSRFPFGDKGVHFVEYAILGFLVAHATRSTWPRHHPVRTALLAIFVTCVWGFVDEIHQGMVPGRTSEVLDLVADFSGATLGAMLRFGVIVAQRVTVSRRTLRRAAPEQKSDAVTSGATETIVPRLAPQEER
jgi:VanZ family protein